MISTIHHDESQGIVVDIKMNGSKVVFRWGNQAILYDASLGLFSAPLDLQSPDVEIPRLLSDVALD